ncbi:MAG: MBL fold metallo-hydrolase [Acidobacteriota bacterium]|nr:MBL fold metallo-hydrolase [Acidobacteriota bacterium]
MTRRHLLSLLTVSAKLLRAADDDPHPKFVSSSRRILTAPELLDAPDEWIERSLEWVEYVLENFPPSIDENPVRRAALIRLDDVLHIKTAPEKPLVQKYYRMRLSRALDEIEQTTVSNGMRVWKLYNHGFLIRTPSVSFTYDIVPGVARIPGFNAGNDLLARIAAQSDATFISHLHGDHANQQVARQFLALGKPVIAPDGLWAENLELAHALTYPKRATNAVQKIPVKHGRQTLTITAYPGHQGESILNNINCVTTPEGLTVIQTGDQSLTDVPGSDFDWIAQIGRDHHVNLLLPNCWANSLHRIVRGVNPDLIITGHENEMGHTVDHREDYTQTYERMYGLRYPFIVMTWGEGYRYSKPA